MGGKKPLRRPLWPPTRATASNYYPLGLDGAGGAAKPLLRAPKKPAPLHGRLPAFSGAVDAFERARKCFLEWRYFFSIILSEFLKNRVALQLDIVNKIAGLCFMVKIKGDRSMFIYLAIIDSPEGKLKFEVIYERYKGLMFYTANSVLGDTRDSEDIVHDAFLKIIEIIDEIDDPKSPQTRYLIVTINIA